MLNQEETEILIDGLIEVIHERCLGYKMASDKIEDPYLKELFKGYANQSKYLKDQLSYIGYGLLPETHLPDLSSAHWSFWKEIKQAVNDGSRNLILEACIKGEERIIEIYSTMLKDQLLSEELSSELKRQFEEIKNASDRVKIFKICL